MASLRSLSEACGDPPFVRCYGWNLLPQSNNALIATYSMISSANTRSLSGTVNPNAFAVFVLMTSSNLTGV